MLLVGALLWTTAGFSQNGDSCSVAVEITADGDYTVADLTGTGAIEASATAAAWYYYTATADGVINVSACAGGNGVDTRLWVYSGDCANLASVANDDDDCDSPNGFASVVLDVPVVSGTTYYISWDDRWSSTGFDFNFEFVPPPSCADLTGLAIPAITETGALVEWNGDGNTAWDLAVDVTGFDINSAILTSVLDTLFAATNLTGGTLYDVYVRTNCGVDGVGEWAMLTFKTLEAGDNCDLPIIVDFAADLPFADIAQTNCGRGDTYDQTCMGSYDNGEDIIYRFELASTFDVEIILDPKGTTYAGIGVFDACPGADNCVATKTWGSSSGADTMTVQLAAGTYYFMVDTWSSPDCIPDFDLNISATAVTCPDVTGLMASEIMPTQAHISWNADGNTEWDVKVDTAGFDIDAATPTTVTDTFVTALVLTPETNYEAYVRTNCGGDVSEWVVVAFTTPCVTEVMTIPYIEDFEGVTAPAMPCGWTVDNFNADDYTWEGYSSGDNLSMAIRWNTTVDMDDLARTPELALTGGVDYTLRFDFKVQSSTYLESMAVILYDDADNALDTLLNFVDYDVATYEVKSAEFNVAGDGNYRVGFYGYSVMNTWRMYVDNVNVFETPDCPSPLSVTMSDVFDVSATASWDNVGPDYQVVWGEAGFDPEGAIAVDVTDTSYNILGLTASTDYEVYVLQDCGSDSYSPWVMASFTTSAEAINGNDCAEANTIDADGSYDVSPLIGTGATADDADAAAWFVYTPTEDGTIDVASCYGGADTRLWIWSGACDALVAVADGDDNCIHATDSTGLSWAAAVYEVPVSAGTTYYIEWDDRWSGDAFVFTFAWNPPAACPDVTNLTIDLLGTSAVANWDDVGVAYQVVWGETGIDPDAETPVDVVTNSYDMTGLTPGITYDVNVRNNCEDAGEGFGSWAMATFTATNPVEGESFEGEEFPPVGWAMIDADGDTYNWLRAEGPAMPAYAGNFSAASESYQNPPGPGALTPDNYLVTPQRHVTADNAEIGWQVAAQDPAWPSENYGLFISTTGNEVADFTTELFVEVLTTNVWEERMVDLSAYIGMDVYLAYRHYNSTDWFSMKIDNVILPGTAVGVNEAENIDFAIYPNPNNGQFTIANKGVTGEYLIEIIDVTGKIVYSDSQTLTSGERTEINPNDVRLGVYMVKLTNTTENYYRTLRMIIK